MTKQRLMEYLGGYYGEPYEGQFFYVMSEYLEGRPPEFYDAACYVLALRYSRRWGKSPGPAEIEQNMSEIRGLMPQKPALPEPCSNAAPRSEALEWMRKIKAKIGGGPLSNAMTKAAGTL